MGNRSFSLVIPRLCLADVGVSGQGATWQQGHGPGLAESLGGNARDEWSEGVMQNPAESVETQVLVSLNMEINHFLLLPENFDSKHAGGARYEQFILLFFMQCVLNGQTEREVLFLERLRWYFS